PIADFGRIPLHVGAADVADRPGGLALDFNREVRRLVGRDRKREKPLRVLACIGMRKAIAELPRHVWIVPVAYEGRRVAQAPLPDNAAGALQVHRSRSTRRLRKDPCLLFSAIARRRETMGRRVPRGASSEPNDSAA